MVDLGKKCVVMHAINKLCLGLKTQHRDVKKFQPTFYFLFLSQRVNNLSIFLYYYHSQLVFGFVFNLQNGQILVCSKKKCR